MTKQPTNTSSIFLKKIHLNLRQSFSKELLDRSKWRTSEDVMAQEIAIELDTYVMGLGDETISIHERWPKTWWDAFKERWFPLWAVKRWPVDFNRIDIEEKTYKAVCPHLESPDNVQCYEFISGHAGGNVSVRSLTMQERRTL